MATTFIPNYYNSENNNKTSTKHIVAGRVTFHKIRVCDSIKFGFRFFFFLLLECGKNLIHGIKLNERKFEQKFISSKYFLGNTVMEKFFKLILNKIIKNIFISD